HPRAREKTAALSRRGEAGLRARRRAPPGGSPARRSTDSVRAGAARTRRTTSGCGVTVRVDEAGGCRHSVLVEHAEVGRARIDVAGLDETVARETRVDAPALLERPAPRGGRIEQRIGVLREHLAI